jgi:hypothetical protein
MLRGKVALLPLPGDEGQGVELAVLWETEGKGDTDLGVIYYRVLVDGNSPPSAARAEHKFEVQLPALPLTYNGTLIKIVWCVRIRRIGRIGSQDTVIDQPFELAW